MKITLESIDGKQFTLRLPRDADAREHVIALHTTRRLRGVYEQDAKAVHLDPVEADEIVGEVTWQLAAGQLQLAGPLRLGPTHLDVDIALDDSRPATQGEARCESFAAPALAVDVDGLSLRADLALGALHAKHDAPADAWNLLAATLDARLLTVGLPAVRAELAKLALRGLESTIGGDSMRLAAASLHALGLALTLDAAKVTADEATVQGLRVSRAAGALTVEADALTLTGVSFEAGPRSGRAGDLRVTGLRYSPEGLSFARLDSAEFGFALTGLDAAPADDSPAPEAPAAPSSRLGVDLPFLDLLHGRFDADTSVDVKLPVIHHRVAKHTARLAITDGTIDFRELEHGLSLLEDALLDLEVEHDGLVLEVDALLTKKPILRWALDAAGLERARRGHIRLRTLLQPTLALPPPSRDDEGDGAPAGEPAVALRRVEVAGLLVEVGLAGRSTLPLAGGTLRLGADDAVALEQLRLRGSLVHDVVNGDGTTELHVEVTGLDLGADGVAGVDVARATLAKLTDATVTMRGFKPTAARGTLRDLSVRSLRWRPTAG